MRAAACAFARCENLFVFEQIRDRFAPLRRRNKRRNDFEPAPFSAAHQKIGLVENGALKK